MEIIATERDEWLDSLYGSEAPRSREILSNWLRNLTMLYQLPSPSLLRSTEWGAEAFHTTSLRLHAPGTREQKSSL